MSNKISIICCFLMICSLFQAQITERKRPKEWNNLILGGKYADRFETMPQGTLSNNTWGCQDVLPRYIDNGIEEPDISFWGGNILKGEDGLYHLFVCGWKESSPKGHMFWSNSTVFHTTSEQPYGPYKIVNSIGKGHNPEAFRLKDGRYIVYVIDGYYIADKLEGPWFFGKFDFDSRGRKIIEGLSNLSFATRPDNSKIMVCRGGGIWISQTGLSPYQQLTDKRIYPNVEGCFEDPVIWKDDIQYHLIVNDWLGRVAFYERSLDGLHWVIEDGEAYVPGISKHQNGTVENWFKYERPKVLQDEYGRVTQMNFAVIDTIKWEDLPNDRHSSKNICIPMNKGLLLSVLNKEPIGPKTKEIDVLIRTEEDMSPADIDLTTLRFGTHSEVNYGRGSKVLRSKQVEEGLILTFRAKGSGITAEEFAPKLIGRYKNGNLVYGYAKVPYINYNPAILSALKPVYQDQNIEVEVKNFGLSTSEKCTMRIVHNGLEIGSEEVPPLQPYQSISCKMKHEQDDLKEKDIVEVIFEYAQKRKELNTFIY